MLKLGRYPLRKIQSSHLKHEIPTFFSNKACVVDLICYPLSWLFFLVVVVGRKVVFICLIYLIRSCLSL